MIAELKVPESPPEPTTPHTKQTPENSAPTEAGPATSPSSSGETHIPTLKEKEDFLREQMGEHYDLLKAEFNIKPDEVGTHGR